MDCPTTFRSFWTAAVASMALAVAAPAIWRTALAAESEGAPVFETDIAPILATHCGKCHEGDKPKGGLSIATATALRRGGDSGPAIVAGNTADSLLVEVLTSGQMPPEGEPKLSPAQIDLLRRWVSAGAQAREAVAANDAQATLDMPSRDVWSFRPLAEPPVPSTASKVASGIDAFVCASLEERKLTLSPRADRPSLVRRLSFDLTGLPPTPEAIEAFLADDRPDAYTRLVGRLLASPHFGEQWGRHWLDAAGYSDVTGGDNDAGIIKFSEGKWKYRDYVVRAFNADKPYDEFVREQLAGDELVDWRTAEHFSPRTLELLVATGFLRNAADDTDEKELATPDIINGVLQRTSEVVVSNLLGLTLNCAKCHDHKYEPISQRDYYRLLANFSPSLNPANWLTPKQRALADISPAEKAAAERHNAEIDSETAKARGEQEAIRRPYIQRLRSERLTKLPEQIRADVQAAVEAPASKRNDVQKYLADKFGAAVEVRGDEVAALLTAEERTRLAELDSRVNQLESTRRSWGTIQAVYEVGPPPLTRLLRRGNHETPGPAVDAGFLAALCTPASASAVSSGPAAPLAPRPIGATSGRRLALANWLTDWQSPAGGLAARVYVNRIWQHLFGRGLVETSENLGRSGAPPTHEALLNWLACRFVAEGGRLKPLVKLIVSSNVYQQASAPADTAASGDFEAAAAVDPANRWYWRMPIKRLEAESVRDAMLAASGRLDPTLFGRPLELENRNDGSVVLKTKQGTTLSTSRRSIYVLARRNYHLSMLGVFDQPAMSTNCLRRQPSAVVLQSLAMLNDAEVLAEAGAFAARVVQEARGNDPQARVERAFRIALGRAPSESEQTWSTDLLAAHATEGVESGLAAEGATRQALTHLCHMLLSSNEFLYVP